MSNPISENHPLREFFSSVINQKFLSQLGWGDGPVMDYISNLLVEFTHMDNLFRIKSRHGKPLEEVGQMLLEADVLLNAGSFEREREVHRHIGDFTLFMVGIFPEYLQRIKSRRLIHHTDFLIDYVKVGKQSYKNVSGFDYGAFKDSVLVFRKLADNFELCILGLGYVREDLERRKSSRLEDVKRMLLN